MSNKDTIRRLQNNYIEKITEFAVATQYGDKARALLALAQAGEIKGMIRKVKNQKYTLKRRIRESRLVRELDEKYGPCAELF